MIYGIFSDVHSNREALEAVLTALASESVDRLLCCGDLVGYAAEPDACVEATRAVVDAVVAGNHDWAAVGKFPLGRFHEAAQAALVWTTERLHASTRQSLEQLPLAWADEHLTLAHGTLHEPEAFHYLLDVRVAERSFHVQRTPVAFVGHTHVPIVFMKDPAGEIHLLRGDRIQVHPGAQYLVNVGSVGQPRDHNPQAAYCLYDTVGRTIEFKRVSYPSYATQAKIRAAGLPERFADRLTRGT